MNLGDQRTSGVDHIQTALSSLAAHLGRDTVRAEDGTRTRRHLVQLFDKHGAGGAQFLNDVLVVDNFLADVNRRTIEVQSNLDHIDSPDDTGPKATGLAQTALLVRPLIVSERLKS